MSMKYIYVIEKGLQESIFWEKAIKQENDLVTFLLFNLVESFVGRSAIRKSDMCGFLKIKAFNMSTATL